MMPYHANRNQIETTGTVESRRTSRQLSPHGHDKCTIDFANANAPPARGRSRQSWVLSWALPAALLIGLETPDAQAGTIHVPRDYPTGPARIDG